MRSDGMALRLARAVAGGILQFNDWRRQHQDLGRAITGTVLLLLGVLLAVAAATTDTYLHRGVESGADPPYVVQPTGKGRAANIDLGRFSGSDLESVISALDAGGFVYVRQPVRWAEIEPTQGEFDWSRLDAIAEIAERHDIQLIAVVQASPDWARSDPAQGVIDSPPLEATWLGTFTAALASRYVTSIPFIQIWNQPNLAAMWGGEPASGATFQPYLAAAFNGARGGNPEVRILAPELAPQPDLQSGLTDIQFLESLYAANGAPYFDVLAISLDGGVYSPDDRRIDPGRFNFSRAVLVRELMVREDDQSTPVWATSYGWAISENVDPAKQAEFVVRGLDRAWSEWPWMGLMVQWSFLPQEDSANAPYAVVSADGNATPLYRRLVDQTTIARAGNASTGFTPMDADAVSVEGRWQDQHLEGRTFRTTSQAGASISLTFQGTGIVAFVRSGPEVGPFLLEIDGEIVPGGGGTTGDEWNFLDLAGTNDFPRTLVSGLDEGDHTLTITLTGEGDVTLGGLVVVREAPFVWPVILMTIGAITMLFFAVRSFIFLIAVRVGHLRRDSPVELWPQLPQMPDWRPGRRA